MRNYQVLFVLTEAIFQWSFQSRIRLPLRLINAKVVGQQKVNSLYCGNDKMPSRKNGGKIMHPPPVPLKIGCRLIFTEEASGNSTDCGLLVLHNV